MDAFLSVFQQLLVNFAHHLPWAIGLAAVFSLLSLFQSQACTPDRPWWKSRDLLVDMQYFFLMPVITPYLRILTVVLIAMMMGGLMSETEVDGYLSHGQGPVGRWPLWAQVPFYMLGTDVLLYWIHRIFHKRTLWPFHAVHHSSLDVDWTTTYRSHPVNQMLGSGLVTFLMIIAGVPASVMLALVPFDIITSAFVHANLNWTLGPLKYVLATPVFHRWHHTAPDQGGDKNFASTFSIWDLMFGTFYMPAGQLPQEFGVDEPNYPQTWRGQMVLPFVQFFERLHPDLAQPAPPATGSTKA